MSLTPQSSHPGLPWDSGSPLCPPKDELTRRADKNSRFSLQKNLRTIREFWTVVPVGICVGGWEQELISQGPLQVVSDDYQILDKAKGDSCLGS